MLARTLLIGIMGWLAWRLYKKRKYPQAARTADGTLLMRQCAHCGLHLPANETIADNGMHFCNEQHRSAYLEQQRNA